MKPKENVFGDRLRMLRSLDENATQKDFAQKLGIPQPTLSAYESGKIKPTVDALINITEKCGVSMDWLCGRDIIFHLRSMGDVISCLFELYESNEISIKTTIHDRVDLEDVNNTDDEDRNWVEIKAYHNEQRIHPEITLNLELCAAISKAYELTEELRRYERNQESYEREKAFFIDYYGGVPLTKIDHSDIPEDERRRRMQDIIKAEWEEMKKKNGSQDT